jgi:hypothetical protein
VATDDTATTAYETAVTIDVLANDSDEDADALSITSTTTPSHGSVTINDGKVVYTPNDGYEGDDSFTYTISDGEDTSTANVAVTVNAQKEDVNIAPVAQDDSAKTAYETAVKIDVLSNDSDEDGDALSISSTTSPANGSVVIESGAITYTPNDDFSGEDSFEYSITDGADNATAKVTVSVGENPNTAPEAKDDTATTAYETAVTIDVLANDSDANDDTLRITSTTTASHGSVSISDGKVVYTPNAGYEGSDAFSYTISDGEEQSSANVTVTVEEKPNTAPIAKDDSAVANYNESVSIAVLENDSDDDGDALTIASYTQPSNGSVTQDGNKLVYTSNTNYSGDDSFSYTITDGEATATATVNVTVKEESKTIQLPIIGDNFGRNDSSESWEALDYSSHDIHFTTKKGNDVSIGLDQDSKLVGSIKVDDKESKVTIDIPDTTMKVDSNGETLIEFKGQDLTILMGDDGSITPTLPTAVVPKTELPVGTALTVSGDLMKFVVPLSNEIKF